MKQNSLTEEFKNLIDDYKVIKVDGLIKDIKTWIKQNISSEYDVTNLANSLDPIEVLDVVKDLSINFDKIGFNIVKTEWMEYQKEENYKAQTLKTKIVSFIKKEIGKSLVTDQEIVNVKRILNQHKLNFQLDCVDEFLDNENLSQKQVWLKVTEDINDKYNYSNWLDDAASNALNISFATHIAKLTHSSISGASNIYSDMVDKEHLYLSTSSLKDKIIEVSQSNNLYAPIGKMLQLENSNNSLSNKLKQGDLSNLSEFAQDEEQLERWKQGFMKVFADRIPATHYLAKQTYFPIEADEYHIINPMQSSSLDQAVFDKVNFVKFSPEMTAIRKSKRDNQYNQNIEIRYPNIAILKVTQSNHGNATPLNGKRGGKRYLFRSTPPAWKSSFNPPLKQESLFDGEFNNKAYKKAKELQKYLLKLNYAMEKQGREYSNKQIRDKVKDSINELIEILFDYAAQVQNLKSQKGWSKESKLFEAHQLWLDPYRDDNEFQEKRSSGHWQEKVCKDFGLWVNKKLEYKKMKFAKFESDKWAKLLKNRLKRFEKGLEVTK